jgi:hypothetical protein
LVEETATGVSDLTVVKAGDQRDEYWKYESLRKKGNC